MRLDFQVWGLEFGVGGLGVGVWGLKLRVQGFREGLGVRGSSGGFRGVRQQGLRGWGYSGGLEGGGYSGGLGGQGFGEGLGGWCYRVKGCGATVEGLGMWG